MTVSQGDKRSAIVFGARNLGRAVIETLVAHGWAVAGIARSQGTLDGVREAGALAIRADVTDPASVSQAVDASKSTVDAQGRPVKLPQDIVDKISKVARNAQDKPHKPVVLESVAIERVA